jgi:hypothetical protein
MSQPTELSRCTLTNNFESWNSVNCPDPAVTPDCDFDNTTYDCVICCTMDKVYNITNWIFAILAIFSTFLIILGGYNIMTAVGNAQQINKGRNYILFSLIGLFLTLVARIVPSIIKVILNIS